AAASATATPASATAGATPGARRGAARCVTGGGVIASVRRMLDDLGRLAAGTTGRSAPPVTRSEPGNPPSPARPGAACQGRADGAGRPDHHRDPRGARRRERE